MLKPISRKSLFYEIVEQIINSIKEGNSAPGSKILTEAKLAETFQVSKNIVREALKALELVGIVKNANGIGTFIDENALANIQKLELLNLFEDENHIDELMEARKIIESELAFLASCKANEEEVKDLEEIIIRTKDSLAKGKYNVNIGLEFHMLIAKLSKNNILEKFLKSITDELISQRGKLILEHYDAKNLEREVNEHIEIFEHIKNKNPVKAKESMFDHIDKAMKGYMTNKL